MNIDGVKNGIVLDHIKAGKSMMVYELLGLDKLDSCVAVIQNADSAKYGKKDIIKIDDRIDIDLDVLGLVARTATVGIVRGGKIVEKKKPTLPEHVVNIIKCVNPRCVTTTEPAVQMFHLVHSDRQEYRCDYCDEEAKF